MKEVNTGDDDFGMDIEGCIQMGDVTWHGQDVNTSFIWTDRRHGIRRTPGLAWIKLVWY